MGAVVECVAPTGADIKRRTNHFVFGHYYIKTVEMDKKRTDLFISTVVLYRHNVPYQMVPMEFWLSAIDVSPHCRRSRIPAIISLAQSLHLPPPIFPYL